MSKLKEIKLRITSVTNTEQITKAMMMVSVSKLRRAQENIENARPYAENLKAMVHGIYNHSDIKEDKYFTIRPRGKAIVIVITSDKGLCGAMNANVIKAIPVFIRDYLKDKYDQYSFVAFGKKGNDYLSRQNVTIDKNFLELRENEKHSEMLDFARHLLLDYNQEKINAIYVLHSRFVSLIKQTVAWSKVLPIESKADEKEVEKNEEQGKKLQVKSDVQYIYEPNKQKILNQLVPLYVENQVMEALLDNIASEHSARMVAMDASTKNAGKLIKKLQLQYNRARQASITSELIEIISGAEVAVS